MLTSKQEEAVKQLWECIASLPDSTISKNLDALREVAKLLEIDHDEFYEFTDGHYLYEAEYDIIFEEAYETSLSRFI